MRRFFYFPHSGKELAVTKCFQLRLKVWILETATHTPIQVVFLDTKEDDLLFETEEACRNYFKSN